jgi:rhamnosyltransferase
MRSKNEQPHADQALIRLRQQTYRNYVLYNVDSGSDDGTFEAVQRFNPVAERVMRIPPEAYVPGAVLNSMIERTREQIIVLLNADAIPMDEKWLENLVTPILNGEADATMSRQVARACAPFIVKRDTLRGYSAKALKGKRTDFFSAVACAFRRSLWEETKFYTDGYAEDLAWSKACREKGGRFELVPDSVVEHSHNFTIKELYRKRYRHGLAFVYIYGDKPDPARQFAAWAKESVRDLISAISRLRPDTIPYNVVYRATIHWAYYRGKCDGQRRYRKEK